MELVSSDYSLSNFRIEQPFAVNFSLKNVTKNPIAANTLLIEVPMQGVQGTIIKAVSPIVQPIPAFGEIKCQIVIKVQAQKTFNKYPSSLSVLIQCGTSTVHQFSLMMQPSLVAQNLKTLVLPSNKQWLNILIFGEYGSGKTSLMLTFLSALKGSLVLAHPEIGVIDGSGGHASTTLRAIPITSNIRFIDAWGTDATNYKDDEFRLICHGMMPVGTEMGKRPIYSEMNNPMIAESLKPDAVFFFITQGLIEEQEYITRLKSFKSVLQKERKEIQPFLILSKIDEIDPELRKNVTMENTLLAEKIERASAETGIPEMFVFPCLNYKSEKDSSNDIDRFALGLLDKTVEVASQQLNFKW